jgi:hypothetical protein
VDRGRLWKSPGSWINHVIACRSHISESSAAWMFLSFWGISKDYWISSNSQQLWNDFEFEAVETQ